MDTDVQYMLYTDGACSGNPGPGGYGCVIINMGTGELTKKNGSSSRTTNNRMEMMAVIVAMESIPKGSKAVLCSDSQYVIRTLEGRYSRGKNLDLWERMDRAMNGKQFDFQWVRGHSGNKYNEFCDKLAVQASQNQSSHENKQFGSNKQNESEKRTSAGSVNAMTAKIDVPEKFKKQKFDEITNLKESRYVNEQCASLIANLYSGEKTFQKYAALRTGGSDYWSRRTVKQMTEDIPDIQDAYSAAYAYLTDAAKALSAARWYARGLSLEDAIRHELVCREIGENWSSRHS